MNPVQIITDSCCDLPVSMREQYGIRTALMSYVIADESYPDDTWLTQEPGQFYRLMREGAVATTSQVTANQFVNLFREGLDSGHDILYIGFSSALSGTLNAASLARNMVLQERPDAVIEIVDSLSASMGFGLLVLEAARLVKEGASLTTVRDWVENNKLRMNHWFTVGDLQYLRRGGRISHLASAMGTLLQVKPVLRVDENGCLVPWCRVRGRRKSLDELCQRLVERIDRDEKQTIAISHADCEADARDLEERVRAQVDVVDCIVTSIGPAIGAHSGPDTLALFFLGQDR